MADQCGCQTTCSKPEISSKHSFLRRGGWLLLALPVWVALYFSIRNASEWIAFQLFGLSSKTDLGESVDFRRIYSRKAENGIRTRALDSGHP